MNEKKKLELGNQFRKQKIHGGSNRSLLKAFAPAKAQARALSCIQETEAGQGERLSLKILLFCSVQMPQQISMIRVLNPMRCSGAEALIMVVQESLKQAAPSHLAGSNPAQFGHWAIAVQMWREHGHLDTCILKTTGLKEHGSGSEYVCEDVNAKSMVTSENDSHGHADGGSGHDMPC